ncbi:MAG: cytochrome-c oxidase, cbb3-type subunit III [Parahaliea sp.]
MSSFWSGWVIFFVLLNWGLVTLLFVVANRARIPTAEDGTSGHIWAHGVIREGVRDLPLWWKVMSILSLAFAVVYLYFYPGFGNHPGSLGWSAQQEVEQRLQANEQQRAGMLERVRSQPVASLAQQADVVHAGGVLYADNCAACHGPEGGGNPLVGAPSLIDASWLFGDGEQIRQSIANGRVGVMPAMSQLSESQARELAEYVYTLNGRESPNDHVVAEGQALFGMYCAACHGQDGSGNHAIGAPDLTDHAWIYGGGTDTIFATITHGRQGEMPAWKGRLSATDITMLMAWIEASAVPSNAAVN